MNDCIYLPRSDELKAETAKTGRCTRGTLVDNGCGPGKCAYFDASVQPEVDAGVPTPGRQPEGANALVGLRAKALTGLDVLPDSHVPVDAKYPPLECPDGGPEIRPLGFGMARPGSPQAPFPVFAMVCGVALDGRCAYPCSFGMYSIDIGGAHARIEAGSRILTAGSLPKVRGS